MTPELERLIARHKDRAVVMKYALADLKRSITRMERLAKKDEWTLAEEAEWMRLQRQADEAINRTSRRGEVK